MLVPERKFYKLVNKNDLRRNKTDYQMEQRVNVVSEILEKRPTGTISSQLNFGYSGLLHFNDQNLGRISRLGHN